MPDLLSYCVSNFSDSFDNFSSFFVSFCFEFFDDFPAFLDNLVRSVSNV